MPYGKAEAMASSDGVGFSETGASALGVAEAGTPALGVAEATGSDGISEAETDGDFTPDAEGETGESAEVAEGADEGSSE